MRAADRPTVTDDARAEAMSRYSFGTNHGQMVQWHDAKKLAVDAFIAGAEWAAETTTVTDDATQRLARAAYAVDSKHHFHEGQDGRPACSCGFVGDARKRTQTEHITAAVLEEYDHD